MWPRFDPRYRELFKLIATLEAPTRSAIHALFFGREFEASRGWNPIRQEAQRRSGIAQRSVRARLRVLVTAGLLRRTRFGLRGNRADAYSLAPGAADVVGDDVAAATAEPTADACRRAWVRSELWAIVSGAASITCGQSLSARAALAEVSGNPVEMSGRLPFDIVHGKDADGEHAFVVLVDDVREAPEAQVAALPVHRKGGATVGVLVRPSDDGSLWLPRERRWRPGRRLETLLALLERTAQYRQWNPRMFRGRGVLREQRA